MTDDELLDWLTESSGVSREDVERVMQAYARYKLLQYLDSASGTG